MEQEKEQILAVLTDYHNAVLAKNVVAFLALYADDVCVFDTWGQWSYEGLDAWRKMPEDWFGSLGDESVLADASEVKIIAGGDVAVIHAIMTFTAVSAAGEYLRSLQNRFTYVLKKVEGKWKIAHEHSSSPADLQTMKVMLRKE